MTFAEMQRDFVLRRKGSAALPITGAIVYAAAALASLVTPASWHNLVLVIAFWTILPLGALVTKLRGETVNPDNPLFRLSAWARVMALATWSVHLMIWAYAPALLPVSIGILFALHWVTFSFSVGHPVGFWHLGARIVTVIAAWLLVPADRMGAVSAAVALCYAGTVPVLLAHWRRVAASA